MDKDVAIVIGISEYPSLGTSYRVDWAVKSAQMFFDWAVSDGEVTDGHHLLLLSGPGNPLSKSNIDDEVGKFLDSIQILDFRRLYFFFAGHGTAPQMEEDGSAFLLSEDSAFRKSKCLNRGEYEQCLRKMTSFSQQFLFFEACRNVDLHFAGYGPTWCEVEPASHIVDQYRYYATKHGGYANQGKEGGLFTEVVIDGLRGGAANAHGQVTVLGLRDHLESNIRALSTKAGFAEQSPDFGSTSGINVSLVSVAPRPQLVIIQVESLGIESVTIYDKNYVEIEKGIFSALVRDVRLMLQPGQYIVEPKGAGTPRILNVPETTLVTL